MTPAEGINERLPEQVQTVARVAHIRADGVVTMVAERRSACESCAAKTGCGVSSLSGVFGKRRLTFAVPGLPSTAKTGDDYVIGIPQSLLLRIAATTYLIPLLAMILAAAAATGLGGGDGLKAAAAGIGLFGGFFAARYLVDRPSITEGVRPTLLHSANQEHRNGMGCHD